MTSSGRTSKDGGIVSPRALAVFSDHQLDSRGFLHRRIGRLLALENATGIDGFTPETR